MILALGPHAMYWARPLLADATRAGSDYDAPVHLSTRSREVLQLIRTALPHLPRQPLHVRPFLPSVIIAADTSDSACGAVVRECPFDDAPVPFLVHRPLSMSEQAESSTVRELRGYLHTLSALAQNYPLCGVDILLLADSLCSCWGFFKHGSQTVSSDGILLISDLCLSIFELSRAHGFRIHISWRRRDEIQDADDVSKIRDHHNFGLRPCAARIVGDYLREDSWVDRFASVTNARCSRFNTRFLSAGAEATDALMQSWRDDLNFVCPPFSLIPRILDKVEDEKAHALLVLPVWDSKVWFRRLATSLLPRIASVWSLGVDALLPLDDDCFFGDRFSTSVILVEVVAFPLARSVDRRIFDPRFLHSVAGPCRLA